MKNTVNSSSWVEADFRELPEKQGLPRGWQDTSKCFKTRPEFLVMQEKGVRFLRLSVGEKGKVQIRLPLKRRFNRETAFRITILGRSSNPVGALLGIRTLGKPEQSDEVDAAILVNFTADWKEWKITTRGGPVRGPVAFYFNFGTAAAVNVDLLYIKVDEIPAKEHTPAPCIAEGHEGHWNGGWIETHDRMRRDARQKQPEIAWWGDSITAGWLSDGRAAWDREFAPMNIMNFGIGGDTVETILWRVRDAKVGEVFSPRLVVLMIGANNLFRIHSPADIAEGMVGLLKEFRQRLPKSRLLLLGVLPSRHNPKDGLRNRIKALNQRYKKLADGKRVLFADVGAAVLEANGSINKDLSTDGTHFLAPGYERLARVIAPKIRQLG
jgi:lysophospholipase L1-like esterase